MERTGAARNENSPTGVKTGFDFSFVKKDYGTLFFFEITLK